MPELDGMSDRIVVRMKAGSAVNSIATKPPRKSAAAAMGQTHVALT
jgi:hypothetical protein